MANKSVLAELSAVLTLDTKAWNSSLKGVSDNINSFNSKLNGIGIAAGLALASAAVSLRSFGEEFGKVQATSMGFRNNFENSEDALNKFRSALKGTVDDSTLMANANLLAAMGVSKNSDEMATLFAIAAQKGREMGISTSFALESIARGIGRVSPLILDNLGIMIPAGFEKMTEGMTDVEKRQKLLSLVLQEGASQAQLYSQSQMTLSERLQAVDAASINLRSTMGQALLPVIEGITSTLLPLIKAFQAFALQNSGTIQKVVSVGLALAGLTVTFIAVSKGIGVVVAAIRLFTVASTSAAMSTAMLTGGITLLLGLLAMAYMKSINLSETNIDMSNTFKKVTDSATKANKAIGEGADDNAKKIQKVKEAIQQENEAFEKQLAGLIMAKEKELSDAKESLDAENKEFAKSQEEKLNEYKSKTDDLKRQNQQRIKDLEESMGRSLVIGSATYEADKQRYMLAIEAEKAAGQKKLEDATKAHQDETKTMQTEHDKRVKTLQDTITKNENLLKKHADVVKGINRGIVDDEISDMIRAHNQRIKELKQQESEVKTSTNKMKDMFKGVTSDGPTIDWSKVFKLPSAGTVLNNLKGMIVNALLEGWALAFDNVGGVLDKAFEKIGLKGTNMGRDAKSAANYFRSLKQKAAGGLTSGLTLVGENGPELINAPSGTVVKSNAQTERTLTKGVVINQTNYIDKSVDQDVFTRNLAFQLRNI